MSRPPLLTPDEATRIASELREARAAGVPWKTLARRYWLSRCTLWRLLREHGAVADKDVSKHLAA